MTRDFLHFEFRLREPDVPLEGNRERFLDLLAEFRLFVGSRVFYAESRLPVVELALQLSRWADAAATEPRAFSYDSFESRLPGLIRIQHGVEGWHIASALQEFASESTFSLEEVLSAVRDFVARVETEVSELHGFSIFSLPWSE